MCRYLMSRGASTKKGSQEDSHFPMSAAAEGGNLNVCMLLYENGAQNDVRRTDKDGWNPFHAVAYLGYDELIRWLVLQGALCADANSEKIKGNRIYPGTLFNNGNRSAISRSCERLVEWAEEITQTQSALVTFLVGTLPPEPGEDQTRSIQCLSGHPGVRKHISDFVGLEVTKRKHLRILQSVVDVLPPFIGIGC